MAISLTLLSWLVICAALPLTLLPRLPDPQQLCLLTAVALSGLLFIRLFSVKCMALLLLVFIWCCYAGNQIVGKMNELSIVPVQAEVEIENVSEEGSYFRLRLLKVKQQWLFPPLYTMASSNRPLPGVCVGQRWQMTLRLRPVHARLNQGGYDMQRRALATHTPLQGRIIKATRLQQDCSLRQRVISASQSAYTNLTWRGLISALAFGERNDMSAASWQLLRETGTAHLMAISGMHIGLAAMSGWVAARGLQFFLPVCWIGYRFPVIISLLLALLYCWLSGASPPAVRAMLALTLGGGVKLAGVRCSSWQIWSWCVGLILLADPLAVLSDSFWLSVVAVAALLSWYQWFALPVRFVTKRRWFILRLFHLQVGLMLLLMPIQAFLFHGISYSALVANLIAVPIVTLVSVPLILLSLLLFSGTLSQPIWWMADRSLALVIHALHALPDGWVAVSQEGALLCIFCWMLLLAWRCGWWRASPLTLISLTVTLFYWRQALPRPDWRLDMLDVGHGLAVVISRNDKAVIYDTGNRWAAGDAGKSIIAPWLRWHGIEPQQVIISHSHLDHIGGLAGLQREWPRLLVRSALANTGHLPCYQGNHWQWQQLSFRVLWPLKGNQRGGNNDSCVVLIDDGKHRVLLTGDLEAPAERALIVQYSSALQADILQVPHHGSKTSSSAPFLRHVQSSLALASVARYNGWRLPAETIIQRYKKNRYQWRDTSISGQLSVQFYGDKWKVFGLREQILPRWYHQWFGVPRESR